MNKVLPADFQSRFGNENLKNKKNAIEEKSSPSLKEEFSDPDIQENGEDIKMDKMIAHPGDEVIESREDLSEDIEEFDARK